uniref:Nuclear pore complex protein Nup98-Nup96 n=1 Tax=Callorhinchus milii TaxID=7868 RepID=A0A4W3IU74_CALMI
MFNKSQFGAPTFGNTSGFTGSAFGQNTGASGFGGFGPTPAGFGATSNAAGGLFGATQSKPGGLFGSSSFGQPATSSTNAGFGFGTPTSSSLFGATNTGGLFSTQPNNAFTQNKPAGSFGTFGTSTSGGGLFGTTSTASNPFGGTSGTLFGGTSFTPTAPNGTTIKFNPPTGTDTMVKSGVSTSISTKHQCITAMKEYETKSLEELRLEDYTAGRKGPQTPLVGAGGLFGASTATSSAGASLFGATPPNTSGGFNFGQNKAGFGASTGAFGTPAGGLFGPAQPQAATGLFGNKPFGLATTTQSTGFSFGNANPLGQPNTSSMSLFGSAPATQSGGIFGTNTNTSTGTGFGTGAGLFGNTAAGFGNVGTGGLFANKPAGFGTTTTSASTFGTAGAGLFGNKPNLTIGANTNPSTFAGHWNACHQLVVSQLASDAIINEKHSYLQQFLERLAQPESRAHIQDWDNAGSIFLQYIRITQNLKYHKCVFPCGGYELERLHTDVMSLCGRIQLIQCHTARDQLAQSDMAKKMSNMMRVVLSMQHSEEVGGEMVPDLQRVPVCLLAPHLRQLPMPEDYALEELRSLTQVYLQELIVAQ